MRCSNAMSQTYILVDFENVQPSADDIGFMRGEGLRLVIFRGPGQMKYGEEPEPTLVRSRSSSALDQPPI